MGSTAMATESAASSDQVVDHGRPMWRGEWALGPGSPPIESRVPVCA
jgi:hypothetical protein